MNKIRKYALVIAILGLLTLVLLSGCDELDLNIGGSGGDSQILNTPPPSQTDRDQQSPTGTQPEQDDQSPATETPAVPVVVVLPEVLIPTASGVSVEKKGNAVVDFSNKQDGYIMAKYTEATSMKIKLLITGSDGLQYQYGLQPNQDFDVFPLTSGNSVYEIGIYKQVEDTRYSMVLSVTIDVVLTDEFAPFLRPNQFVDFDQDSAVVRKAAELTAGIDVFMEKVAAIYNFVITNVVYDEHLAETVQSGYVPVVDRTMETKKGICFDYASMMAAMLRSQGIPTKLVIGYTGEVLHAWISVYSEEDGWLDEIIFFDGYTWKLVDPTFAANASSRSLAQFIGDGSNYAAIWQH